MALGSTTLRELLGKEKGAGGLSDDRVHVCCRVRPLNDQEREQSMAESVTCLSPTQLEWKHSSGAEETHRFGFDKVFPSFADQQLIYEHIGAPMIESILAGVNGCIMAYGQTGSGKTHTISGAGAEALAADMGAEAHWGLTPRLFRDLFRALRRSGAQFDVRGSCVEIYQERMYDLVTVGRTLEMFEDQGRGLTITGATEVPLGSAASALRLFAEAVTNRRTFETKMNHDSSRSHAVFILTVAKRDVRSGVTSFAQLYIADLAGSERVSKTGAEGDRLEEAKYINKSLLALGRVIYKLSSGEAHVPYRDSHLTRLLQNSIGGNSRTVLLCTVSPSAWHEQETLSTLRFGQMTKRIRNTAHANEVVVDEQLEDMIEAARERLDANRRMLHAAEEYIDQFQRLFKELKLSPGEVARIANAIEGLPDEGAAAGVAPAAAAAAAKGAAKGAASRKRTKSNKKQAEQKRGGGKRAGSAQGAAAAAADEPAAGGAVARRGARRPETADATRSTRGMGPKRRSSRMVGDVDPVEMQAELARANARRKSAAAGAAVPQEAAAPGDDLLQVRGLLPPGAAAAAGAAAFDDDDDDEDDEHVVPLLGAITRVTSAQSGDS